MYEKEKIIREQRTIEASRKGLMGLDGKLGCVLRYLGKPVIREDGGWIESNEGEDFHSYLFEDDRDDRCVGEPIPGGDDEVDDAGWRGSSQEFHGTRKAEADEGGPEIGWHFDGLSRGMHIEIQYMAERHELSVTWQGRHVYREVAGELHQYVPQEEWEKCVDRLHHLAKRQEGLSRRFDMEVTKAEVHREKMTFLDTLKKLWGI